MSHNENNKATYFPIDSSDSAKIIMGKRELKTVNAITNLLFQYL